MARQMKDSGIEWIGEIPEYWSIARTKAFFSHHKHVAGEAAERYERLALTLNGVIRRPKDDSTGLQPEAFNGYQILRPNELVFKLIDLENVATSRVGYSPYTGIVSPAYIVLSPREEQESKFGEFFFLSLWQREIFNHMGDDGVRSSLNAGDLLNIPYPVAPADEKKRIVAFLDRKCAEIDAVIERTKATIEEYKKLKQAVITEAVTKGVRGPRPMKDSRIEWLDSVPLDWNECRIKNVIFPQEKPITESDEVITCFRDGEVTLRKNRREDGFTISFTEHGYHGVDIGDLVIHGMDAFAGAIGCSDSRGKTTPVVHVCSTAGNNRYFMYFLRSMAYGDILMDLSNGVRIRSSDYRNFAKLGVFGIVVPPIDEQNEIVDFLDKRCVELDTLIAKKTALLTELETYKKSLIYEYVTGKTECIDVQVQEQAHIVYPSFPAAINTDKPRFAQAVLMSKILDSNVKQMGRVKLEKMLYTIETSIGFDFDTEYVREAAGPLHSSIYECEGIIGQRNKWFTLKQSQHGVSYTPTSSKDKYKKYYDKYFGDYAAEIDCIISVFRDYTMDQAEIIATLFAAWNDAVIDQKQFTDEDIVDDVLNNWHESKKRFPRDVWLRAMEQMRKNGLVPKGYGKRTVIKKMEVNRITQEEP